VKDSVIVNERLAVGVDIGGTKIAFALVNEQGETVASEQLPTLPAEGSDAVINRLAVGIHLLLEKAQLPVAGIGVGCPGMVDPTTGMSYHAVNLGWKLVPLRDELRQRLGDGLPIWMHNDVKAGAIGERYFGAARGCDDFIYLAIGTGLGGAAVSGGRLIRGDNFFPMDVGHLSFNPEGRLCGCGQHGCVEMYASGNGLVAGVREHQDRFPDSPLSGRNPLTTSDILQAAEAGDTLALAVLDEAALHLGMLLASSVAVLNPARLIIGGGLGAATFRWLLAGAQREMWRRVLPPLYEKLQIVQSQVSSSAVGAACLVWDGLSSALDSADGAR
jgi:glucokinase